mgnify:CR=1 FL=1
MAYTNNSGTDQDIRYTGRDFASLKANLVEFAKNYFPNTVNDFTSASPSTMFIEMAAYVGDVLSYYTDYAMRETMLHRAQEKKNVYALAQAFGYKPRIATPASALVNAYILIPSKGTGEDSSPDYDYAPRLERGMVLSTADGKQFRTTKPIDFAVSSSVDETDVSIYQTNAITGAAEWYLLKKQCYAQSGEQKTISIPVGAAQEYFEFTIDDNDVQSIDEITDADGMTWNEVPYLAQETVFDESVNNTVNDPYLADNGSGAPYILKLKTVSRRFISRVTPENKLKIMFGSGVSNSQDEEIIPNPENVGTTVSGNINTLDKAFDPSNFLYTNTYGQAPSNTTLSITYTKGYGLAANVGFGSINTISQKNITFNPIAELVSGTRSTVIDSLYVESFPATGGSGAETVDNVRRNALGYHSTQNRIVTREDYIVRALSMPSKFGTIAKAYVASDEQMLPTETLASNPLAINLYVLSYDKNRKLAPLSAAAKENLKTYLSQYRLMTDAINIKDGFVVNIGVDFEISVLAGYNTNQVLVQCISSLKDKLKTDKLSFTTPIYKTDLYTCIANIEGVQSVAKVDVVNKFGSSGGYSSYRYNIENATFNDIIYPSLDPSVFEVTYPDQDIKGKVVSY